MEAQALIESLQEQVAQLHARLAESEARQRATEERFDALVQDTNAIIGIVDTGGRLTYLSESVRPVLGFSVEDLLHRSVLEIVHPDDRAAAEAFFNAVASQPRGQRTTELRTRHSDGSWRVLDVSAKNGLHLQAIQGIVVNGRDITERRQFEQALLESEERFRSLVQGSDDIITIVDHDGIVQYESQSVERMLGYPVSELMYRSVFERIHPDDLAEAKQLYDRVIAAPDDVISIEVRYQHRDGSWRVLEVRAKNFFDNPSIGGIVLNSRDITARRQIEMALRESEERYRFVARATNDVIWDWDLRNDSIQWNEGVYLALGYGPDEDVNSGDWWETHIHPDDRDAIIGSVERAHRGGDQFWIGEYRFLRADGEYAHVTDRGYIVRDEQGRAVRMIGALTDITERYRVQEALQRALDEIRTLNVELEQRVTRRTAQLEAVNRELEAFSYSVSHDLRAPLRALDGFSHALLEDYSSLLPEEGRFFLQRIRAGTQRMGQLIDDLLKLSRLTRDEMRLERVDLSALARSIAAELREMEPERNVTFAIADGLTAMGDARLLRAALQNLLANAWKFTSKEPAACIEFGALAGGDGHSFYVRDNGVGFDMTYADKLFGAFQRLHSQTEFEGTGVGLATVQRVIHRHGGDVWAHGEPGVGATLYFRLP